MKVSSKYSKPALLFTATIALTAITVAAGLPATLYKRGTDILHFFVQKAMSNEGVESTAAARISARQNQQGRANNQSLDITVKGLGTKASCTNNLIQFRRK